MQRLQCVAAMLVAVLYLTASARGAVLLGHWELEETSTAQPAVDSSGTNPAGTYSAAVNPNVLGPAGFGSAAYFNGTNTYVDVGGATTLNLVNDFTVAAWIKLDNTTGKHSYFGHSTWAVRSDTTRPQITTFGVKDYVGTTGTLSAGTWYHVAVVLDASDDATFYVNGNPAGFDPHNVPAVSALTAFAIGARNPGNSAESMVGYVDDVRFFSGALTQTEVQALMTDYTAATVPQIITPVAATSSTAGTDFFPVIHLIDGSGLSATPTYNTFLDVTHVGTGSTNAWVTAAPNGSNDYFLATSPGPAPQLTFDLGGLYELTDLVAWNYSVAGNAAEDFLAEFLIDGIVQGPAVPLTFPQTTNPAHLISLGGTYRADTVRLTIVDNYFAPGTGGDRIGLAEIRFIGSTAFVPEPASATLALLGLATLMRRRRRAA